MRRTSDHGSERVRLRKAKLSSTVRRGSGGAVVEDGGGADLDLATCVACDVFLLFSSRFETSSNSFDAFDTI